MKPQTFHFIANKCLYSIAVGTNWLIHSCKKKNTENSTNKNTSKQQQQQRVGIEENSTSSVAVGCNSICVDEFVSSLKLVIDLFAYTFSGRFLCRNSWFICRVIHFLLRNWFRFSWNFVEFIHFCVGNSVFPIWLSESN